MNETEIPDEIDMIDEVAEPIAWDFRVKDVYLRHVIIATSPSGDNWFLNTLTETRGNENDWRLVSVRINKYGHGY